MGRWVRRERPFSLYPKGFWPTLAAPGALWLAVLFLIPFYAVVGVALGGVDPILRIARPEWNPLYWNPAPLQSVLGEIFSSQGIFREAFLRTLAYVFIAGALCLLIGYPVAYYISRHGGRLKTPLLVLLIAPFWISYLMRMLAWVNLLSDDGYVNKFLMFTGTFDRPYNWLDGRELTLILGLVYGYVPFLILPLFAALDRIDVNLLEAARDLGASPFRTFVRVTLPLSRQGILAGSVIIMLPMFGDYYTNDLLSNSPRTAMIGNLIDSYLHYTPGGQPQGAGLVVTLMVMLMVLMLYYLYSTARASREARIA